MTKKKIIDRMWHRLLHEEKIKGLKLAEYEFFLKHLDSVSYEAKLAVLRELKLWKHR